MKIKIVFLLMIIITSCNQQKLSEQYRQIDSLKAALEKEKSVNTEHQAHIKNKSTSENISSLKKEISSLIKQLSECSKANQNAELKAQTHHILPTFMMHSEEYTSGYQQFNWTGLFIKNGTYYLAPAEVDFQNVHDPIIDISNEKTGVQPIISNNTDSCIFLITSININEKKLIPSIKLSSRILPDDNITFDLKDNRYSLYATGIQEGQYYFGVSNYKLFLKAFDKIQTLHTENRFYDTFIEILWAGDMDGDNKLDLIIDTANHFNSKNITLFLSGNANNNIVEKVASKKLTGC